jgi:hypothetical protein
MKSQKYSKALNEISEFSNLKLSNSLGIHFRSETLKLEDFISHAEQLKNFQTISADFKYIIDQQKSLHEPKADSLFWRSTFKFLLATLKTLEKLETFVLTAYFNAKEKEIEKILGSLDAMIATMFYIEVSKIKENEHDVMVTNHNRDGRKHLKNFDGVGKFRISLNRFKD